MPKPKTFADLGRRYVADRVISDGYRTHVIAVCRRLGEVSNTRLNAFLKRRLEQVSGITVCNERTIALCVWLWAFHAGIVDEAPRGIAKLRARRTPTRAWTIADLKRLLDRTKRHDRETLKSGANKGEFFRAWILLGYESGARHGDLWRFSREHVKADSLAWTQHKTGEPLTRTLSPACLDAVHAMLARSPDGTILGWSCRRRQAMRLMRDLIDSAGLDGTSKWLRRSGATHCEMEQPGAGQLHLGHRSPALFEQAYCDWSQLRTKTPKTPALM